jgi:hypothetical protein
METMNNKAALLGEKLIESVRSENIVISIN